jgi:hypothetical protein
MQNVLLATRSRAWEIKRGGHFRLAQALLYPYLGMGKTRKSWSM